MENKKEEEKHQMLVSLKAKKRYLDTFTEELF